MRREVSPFCEVAFRWLQSTTLQYEEKCLWFLFPNNNNHESGTSRSGSNHFAHANCYSIARGSTIQFNSMLIGWNEVIAEKILKSRHFEKKAFVGYNIAPWSTSVQHASSLDLRTLADEASTPKADTPFQDPKMRNKKGAILWLNRKRLFCKKPWDRLNAMIKSLLSIRRASGNTFSCLSRCL